MEKEKKKELWRTIKFTLFSLSAGAIELGVEALCLYAFKLMPALSYLIALVASVVWNFTFNRKFTFKSANNVPKAMLLVFLFYLVFTPATCLLTAWLTDGNIYELFHLTNFLGWDGMIATIICMVINFITEYLYDKFVVFKDSIDTNDIATKEKEKENENN